MFRRPTFSMLLSMFPFKSPPVLLLFICVLNCIQLDYSLHVEVKRDGMEMKENIGSKFSIKQNTIILTVESRTMGAHYLNETDFTTNEECLIWCWRNPSCNVAVFEGMTRHSCFLFDCGSPADFRCKFTHHNFYTSSIMKATQHSYDLKQWGKDEKQKDEIAPSKQPSTVAPSSVLAVQTVPTSAVLNTPTSTTVSQVQAVPKVPIEKKCRHYQFQCVNSSDCIAIYNVCDGIPQCPDGSDESTYLQCPSKGKPIKLGPSTSDSAPTSSNSAKLVDSPSAVVNNVVTQPPPPHVVLKPPPPPPHMKPPHRENANLQRGTINNHQVPIRPEMNRGPPLQESYDPGQSVDYDTVADGPGSPHTLFSHKHSKFVAANDPRTQYPIKYPEEYERYPQQQQQMNIEQQYSPYENGYPPTNEGYLKGQYPDYDRMAYDTYHQEDNPFWMEQERLKGSGYISNDYSPSNNPSSSRQIPYPSREEMYASRQLPMKSENVARYPPPQMEKPVINRPHVVHDPRRPKVVDPDNYSPQRPNQQRLLRYGGYDDIPRTDYRMYPDFSSQGIEGSRQRISPNVFDSDEAIRESLAKQLQPQPEPANMYEPVIQGPAAPTVPNLSTANSIQKSTILENQNNENDKTEVTTLQALPSKPNPTKINQPKHEALVLGKMTDAELAQSQHTHKQERNNAILALILGLVVTSLLIVLVGCRMKTLRRRSARRNRTLAHDADYLVNGLYL